jgi:hypothetical protein
LRGVLPTWVRRNSCALGARRFTIARKAKFLSADARRLTDVSKSRGARSKIIISTPCNVIIVPMPVVGSPSWALPVRQPWTKPTPDHRQGWQRQAIPQSGPIDRDLIQRLIERAKQTLEQTKGLRAALLAA